MEILMSAATDRGTVRKVNEDYYYYSRNKCLVIVCDGMGGHNAGEKASRIAGETVRDVFLYPDLAELAYLGQDVRNRVPLIVLKLVVGIRLANRRLRMMAESDPNLQGMGTTIAAMAFSKSIACAVHVGDSRVYQISKENIRQLTEDHSWINELLQDHEIKKEEVKHFRKKNVLTRALGTHPATKIDVQWLPLTNTDTFLLCSDGLHNALSSSQIHHSFRTEESARLQKKVEGLVLRAKATDGSDNITAAVVRIDNPSPGPISRRHHGKMTVAEEPARLFPVEDRFIQRVYYGTESKPKSRGRFRPSGRIAMAAAGLGIVVAALWYGVMRPDSPRRNVVSQRPDNDIGTMTGDSLTAKSAANVSNPAATPALPGLSSSSAQSAQAGGPTFGAHREPTTSFSPRSDSTGSLNRRGQAEGREKSVPAAVSSPAKSDASMPASSRTIENLGRARTSTALGGNPPALREPQTINLGEDTLVVSSPSSLTPRTGGRVFLPGLNSPRYEGTFIYANDGLIGPVREFAEPGFTLRPGIYTITIKDSTGRVLHERANVAISRGDVKPLELNKPR